MKKLLSVVCTILVSASVMVGCAQNNQKGNTPATPAAPAQSVTLTVGATPVPHAEILQQVKPILQKQGINLVIKEFTDYVLPNQALSGGEIDANFFQHVPYMDKFNQEHGTKIVASVPVHFEPLGLYGGKQKSLDSVQVGSNFAVPNDPTNEARALLLLQSKGLIQLPANAGLNVTAADIKENPKKIVIKEFDAAMIPRMLGDVDFAVINGNYAIQAGLKVKDALAAEDKNSVAAKTYANVLAVRQGENRPEIKKLEDALHSDEVRKFIEQKYQGSVVPVF